ncbi:MAG TPA: amidohydrolase [Gemmatimonadaceae bacterium]|nr:amidohydrolase [Gemmatimonadaceae bacterium]
MSRVVHITPAAIALAAAVSISLPAHGQAPATAALVAPTSLHSALDKGVAAVAAKVIAWRRDFHEHPELSNRETRTAKIVADHLRSLGIEVRAGVAKTGVVGILRGGRPGPTVALRADMDALPVTEETGLPFRSQVRTEFGGQTVGVMHACGHDLHTAALMGAAETLAGVRAELPGTVVFLFQPAEEGAPPGERGGASLMIEEGALANPKVDAIFGLHVFSGVPVGEVRYRSAGLMASSDTWDMVVRGRQTHGALPWGGVDPIFAASQIVVALQSIVSRQVDLTATPAVVTVGTFQGGVRFNIIPDSVVLSGTIRTFDPAVRADIKARVKRTAEQIASASGATATFATRNNGNPVTFNEPALTDRMRPTIERVAGPGNAAIAQQTTTAEDFAHYQQRVPGVFIFVGATPPGVDPATAPPNHSPRFVADEGALPLSVRLLTNLAVDFLSAPRAGSR